ncbi:hypothetical protein M0638_22215 [Roseomonas sp. NAR14]|uniref:Peptidoglycan binding protein n=1 Tax=Roseomonas acroporae TaxID=2937791 RepID=A0A9X2BYM7_9PROT|nr:hypothetical protein [Roseomonas acroporae]
MNHFPEFFDFILAPNNDGQPYHLDPRDPGGMTAWGVIAATWASYHGKPLAWATKARMQKITREDVRPIYRQEYWDRWRCDELPAGIDLVVADMSCGNMVQAPIILQRLLGVAQDGKIGPITVAKAHAVRDVAGFLDRYETGRIAFYRTLSTWPIYGGGWSRRAREATALGKRLAGVGMPVAA